MFTKLKKTIVKGIFKVSILKLESQGAVLRDIEINIEEVDGEVYGKLEMVNVLIYYSKDMPMLRWQFNQDRLVEVHTKGWSLYFNEEMEELPERLKG